MNNATGMINLARNIGGSVGISLVTTLQARLAQKHQADLISDLSPINPRYRAMLQGLTGALHIHGESIATATQQAQAILYGETQRQAAMLAFIDVFWILGVVCIAMIPLVFIMKKAPPHQPVPLAH